MGMEIRKIEDDLRCKYEREKNAEISNEAREYQGPSAPTLGSSVVDCNDPATHTQVWQQPACFHSFVGRF